MLGRGDLVDDRFLVEDLVASGGMGAVHRAVDQRTGAVVALKVLRGGDRSAPMARERFLREARVLAQLSHEAIVGYVAHGFVRDGSPFLAMQWLDGQTLSQRLERGPLTVADTLVVGRRVADALEHAHSMGIVHRDVKPSNLLLVGGRVEDVRLLDFGVARLAHAGEELTRTGVAVGTAAYMAPEQARGTTAIDGRADLYALGVVLHRCLTGEVPFRGSDIFAILTRVLLEPAPSVREARTDVPPALATLVLSLLAKEPEERPRSARVVRSALDAIDASAPETLAEVPSIRFSDAERRLISLVAVGLGGTGPDAPTAPVARWRIPDLAPLAAQYGARIERPGDAGLLAVLEARGSGTDLAELAGRLALAVRATVTDAPIALAIGPADLSGRLPAGEVLERAFRLLDGAPRGVRIDDVTAGLLDGRFHVEKAGPAYVLVGMTDGAITGTSDDTSRAALGFSSPFVGREREMGVLMGLVDECAADRVARAVVLTGAPGVGKSRLLQELVRALGDRNSEWVAWPARGESLLAGAPLGIVRQLARAGLRLPPNPTAEEGRAALVRAVRLRFPEADAHRIETFLGELVDLPVHPDDVQLRAARLTASLMADQLQRAWEDLVRAEASERLLVFVLDDMQWGDVASVRWIDALLAHADVPLLVVTAGRPELDEELPKLWHDRGCVRLPVAPLSRRASESLVRGVLGDAVGDDTVSRILSHAAGNAFFLEELVRRQRDGTGDSALPETLLAMVQAQLQKLDPLARRVLRAGSVFGATFDRRAVGAILGPEVADVDLDSAIRGLLTRAFLRRGPDTEFSFRHELVRDAAYASLTERDRTAGHFLAARWLQANGGSAMALAEHNERAGRGKEAAAWYRRAAEQAIDASEFDQALRLAEKAAALEVTGDALAAALHVMALAHRAKGEAEPARATAARALVGARPGSELRYRIAGTLALACMRTGATEELAQVGEELLAERAPECSSAYVRALALGSRGAYYLQNRALAQALFARMEKELAAGGGTEQQDPDLAAAVAMARESRAYVEEDYQSYFEQAQARFEAHAAMGDRRGMAETANAVGFASLFVGAHERGEAVLREGIAIAERMGMRGVVVSCKGNLALTLQRVGKLTAALAVAEETLALARALGDATALASTLLDLTGIHLERGAPDLALACARDGVRAAGAVPVLRAYSRALLARALLAIGANDEALVAAREARAGRADLVLTDPADLQVELALAEALRATGDAQSARRVVLEAMETLEARAARIRDAEYRAGFLAIPENAALRALAARM
jgi:tetratricopeptide (TPR) repeat protein